MAGRAAPASAHVAGDEKLSLQGNSTTNESSSLSPDTGGDVTAEIPYVNVSIYDFILDDPDLTTLAATFSAVPSLAEELASCELTKCTIFAPTNDAFSETELPQDDIYLPEIRVHLQNLLSFHIAKGLFLESDLVQNLELTMLNNEAVSFNVSQAVEVIPSTPNSEASYIIDADNIASDGVIHKIDSVLLPSFVSTSFIDVAENDPQLSILNETLDRTGTKQVLAQLTNLYSGYFTLFAPSNDALLELGIESYDSLFTFEVMSNHVLYGACPKIVLAQEDFEPIYHPLATLELEFGVNENNTVTVNGARIIDSDIFVDRGIIHVIDKVLLVPSVAPTAAPLEAECLAEEEEFDECIANNTGATCKTCLIELATDALERGCDVFSLDICPAIEFSCPCSGCHQAAEDWVSCQYGNATCRVNCGFKDNETPAAWPGAATDDVDELSGSCQGAGTPMCSGIFPAKLCSACHMAICADILAACEVTCNGYPGCSCEFSVNNCNAESGANSIR